jgi:hypothetical protein
MNPVHMYRQDWIDGDVRFSFSPTLEYESRMCKSEEEMVSDFIQLMNIYKIRLKQGKKIPIIPHARGYYLQNVARAEEEAKTEGSEIQWRYVPLDDVQKEKVLVLLKNAGLDAEFFDSTDDYSAKMGL